MEYKITLKEYVDDLKDLCKKYPNAILVYSSDNEGTKYTEVKYIPSEGKFENGTFLNVHEALNKKVVLRPSEINAICIN